MEVHQIITGAVNNGENSYAVGSVEGVNFTACAVGCDIVVLDSGFQRVQIIPGTLAGSSNVQVTCIDCCSETGKIAAAYLDIIRVFEPCPLQNQQNVHKLDYQWFETACFTAASAVCGISWSLEGLRLLVNCSTCVQLWQLRWLTENYDRLGDALEDVGRVPVNAQPKTSGLVSFNVGASDLYAGDHQQSSEDESLSTQWDCVWKQEMPSPVKYMQFSPDGLLFATAGGNDRLVKVWYETASSGIIDSDSNVLCYSFSYLAHPAAVTGFEWRKTGRYMPRRGVINVLMSWCVDHVCRIWCETVESDSGLTMLEIQDSSVHTSLEHSSLLKASSAALNTTTTTTSHPLTVGHHKRYKSKAKDQRGRLVHRLKILKHIKNSKSKAASSKTDSDPQMTTVIAGGPATSNMTSSLYAYPSCHVLLTEDRLERGLPHTLHFHIAATISAETDCFLVPSMHAQASRRRDSDLKFCVHWLNNKEFMFSLGAEKLLAEALQLAERHITDNFEVSPSDTMGTENASMDERSLRPHNLNGEFEPHAGFSQSSAAPSVQRHHSNATLTSVQGSTVAPTTISSPSTDSNVPNTEKDVFSAKLDSLMREWTKSSDALFCIHPVDGSLLVWNVDWLDDGTRQPQISFSSRLPSAFALTDAVSLQNHLITFNPHDPVFVDLLHPTQEMQSQNTVSRLPTFSLQPRNTVFLLTSHVDGSLNLWHLTLDEKSKFSIVLNISHRSRMCGHRFCIRDISCHPVLPLFLTTSNHNIKPVDKLRPQSEMSCFNSELCLWKVDPVLPLCKSGGVRELARINSPDYLSFSVMSWIPTVLPSSTLGTLSNSESSCFVAFNGTGLHVYQAVVDARTLLAHHASMKRNGSSDVSNMSSAQSSPEHIPTNVFGRKGDAPVSSLKVVSSQSTARPGCIIDIGLIEDTNRVWGNAKMLHVFQESLVLSAHQRHGEYCGNGSGGRKVPLKASIRTPVTTPTDSNMAHHFMVRDIGEKFTEDIGAYSDSFYLIVLDQEKNRAPIVHMWLLELSSEEDSVNGGSALTDDNQPIANGDINGLSRDIRLARKSSSAPADQHRLFMTSTKVCQQTLSLPPHVTVIEACPAVGHLSSTSIYPACTAPYQFSTGCSDDKVRFWQCKSVPSDVAESKFEWVEWKMALNAHSSSDLEVDGRLLSLSCAYSGRFAAAIDPSNSFDTRTQDKVSIQVAVFECESTGGTQWIQEDVINLRNIHIPKHVQLSVDLSHTVHSAVDDLMQQGGMVRSASGSNLIRRMPSMPDMAGAAAGMRRAIDGYHHKYEQDFTKQVVRIDWVSSEDGAFILTVGVGPKIFLYAALSEDLAQQNVSIMKDHEARKKPKALTKMSSLAEPARMIRKLVRWVNLRTIELHSADSRPPLPMMLGWIREGILIVGMETEMRVYSQWNVQKEERHIVWEKDEELQQNPPLSNTNQSDYFDDRLMRATSPNLVGLQPSPGNRQVLITPSHSVLDLSKKSREGASTLRRKPKLFLSNPSGEHTELNSIIELVRDEGLFEAARMCSPMIPQYHPKQLMELLNAGKTRRVKAILLHVLRVLKDRRTAALHRLAQLANRGGSSDDDDVGTPRLRSLSRSRTDASNALTEDVVLDYTEIEPIPPLPLFALIAADSDIVQSKPTLDVDSGLSLGTTTSNGAESKSNYDELFSGVKPLVSDDFMDEAFDEDDESGETTYARRRRPSVVDLDNPSSFSGKHTRVLTNLLTHTHLPGLSSVDQMHLLAAADTISSFSSDVMDKLTSVNAAYRQTATTVIENTAGGGYAGVGSGSETVDDRGLRYLMALKQHEYLIRCLPIKPRKLLKSKGLATSHVIWAFHSETETEILNSIPSLKSNPTWDELRSTGAGWWLTNAGTLRLCIEKVAKAAFQAKQDPMDSAIFYIAMRKKNVLWGLFRSVSDDRMALFFKNDFTTPFWQKAAMKNAFVLMGKQRFLHAVAFFLLAGSLSDALQVCLSKLCDLQLAIVVIKLYESDLEVQTKRIQSLLSEHVFGCSYDEMDSNDITSSYDRSRANSNPFLRSMALWQLKNYYGALTTLLDYSYDDAGDSNNNNSSINTSDVFNFYTYLRNHPVVIRQRLQVAEINVVSTEQYLQAARDLENVLSPAERRLYFETASTHLKSGCPLMALDVLCRLPKSYISEEMTTKAKVLNKLSIPTIITSSPSNHMVNGSLEEEEEDGIDWGGTRSVTQTIIESSMEMDWGSSTVVGDGGSRKEKDDGGLVLQWSDDDESEEEDEGSVKPTIANDSDVENKVKINEPLSNPSDIRNNVTFQTDIMAQQLKFVACLKLMAEELSTLASGYEVEGGQLRYQLFYWLEKEIEVLKDVCDYCSNDEVDDSGDDKNESVSPMNTTAYLHDVLQSDRLAFEAKIERAIRRRRWLARNESLLRTFAAYCGLHSQQGVGLTSARMELLLLLQELRQEPSETISQLDSPIPVTSSFPLLAASVASHKSDIADPIRYLQSQTTDILLAFVDLVSPPDIENISKVSQFYSLAQCLSACIYESLCDIENTATPIGAQRGTGHLLRSQNKSSGSFSDDPVVAVCSEPSKWPGVQTLISLLSRDRDDDAPNLRLLLAEAWVAVYVALLSYALAAFDARWLYRLMAHPITPEMFSSVFGGGGEKRTIIESARKPSFSGQLVPPQRPPPPRAGSSHSSSSDQGSTTLSVDKLTNVVDPSKLRAKFHARVFGPPGAIKSGTGPQVSGGKGGRDLSPSRIVTTKEQWVPPKYSIVAYFTGKPPLAASDLGGMDYDSDATVDSDGEVENESEEFTSGADGTLPTADVILEPHIDPNSYAWTIVRLAVIRHATRKIHQFVSINGLDVSELPSISSNLQSALKALDEWKIHLISLLDHFPNIPSQFIPHMDVQVGSVSGGPVIQKYRTILEQHNTPFTEHDVTSLPVRRLWMFLVRQEHLSDSFIRYIFKGQDQTDFAPPSAYDDSVSGITRLNQTMYEPMRIMQREQDPITSFCVSQCNRGYVALSTAREVQEMDISAVMSEKLDWMHDQTELDLALNSLRKSPLKDNDDYMLLQNQLSKDGVMSNNSLNRVDTVVTTGSSKHTLHLTPYVVDRSRYGLRKVRSEAKPKLQRIFGEHLPPIINLPYLCKREMNGVKKMEAHPHLPYYLTGSSDGAVRMWEWGIVQPTYTPRSAGQFAKVTRVQFSPFGNKFGITDHDGSLCMWQLSHGMTLKRPYLNIKCHTKQASDFAFVSGSSSLICTAGHSSNEANVALWDTLLPPDRAAVHSWSCHTDGATAVQYVPQALSILSAGKRGEICIFDVRQRLLRQTFKVFDHAAVKCLALDPNGEFFVTGSSDGDIKVWSVSLPQLLYSFPGEHSGKSGFSLRTVGSGHMHGVAQLWVDTQQRLYSCGADCSLKLRVLPTLNGDQHFL